MVASQEFLDIRYQGVYGGFIKTRRVRRLSRKVGTNEKLMLRTAPIFLYRAEYDCD